MLWWIVNELDKMPSKFFLLLLCASAVLWRRALNYCVKWYQLSELLLTRGSLNVSSLSGVLLVLMSMLLVTSSAYRLKVVNGIWAIKHRPSFGPRGVPMSTSFDDRMCWPIFTLHDLLLRKLLFRFIIASWISRCLSLSIGILGWSRLKDRHRNSRNSVIVNKI